MLTEADLELRRQVLTATDMTILAGVSPYGRGEGDIYLDKLGLSERSEPTQAMNLGHRLEPVALALLAETFEVTLRYGSTERHPILTWAGATPDADVLDITGAVVTPAGFEGAERVAVAEAKAVGLHMAHRWGESGDPEAIPDEVRVQTTWQNVVTRTKRAYVVALVATEAKFYVIEYDDALGSALLDLGDRWWKKHVIARVPPTVDGTEASARMVRGLFRKSTVGLVEPPAGAEELVCEYVAASKRVAVAEAAKLAAQAKLCAAIGEAEGFRVNGYLATWKARKGAPDYKLVSERLGASKELVDACRHESKRVLNVKATEEGS